MLSINFMLKEFKKSILLIPLIIDSSNLLSVAQMLLILLKKHPKSLAPEVSMMRSRLSKSSKLLESLLIRMNNPHKQLTCKSTLMYWEKSSLATLYSLTLKKKPFHSLTSKFHAIDLLHLECTITITSTPSILIVDIMLITICHSSWMK